ncbi:MAG: VCBS repeat-containing protein [Planctomycetota bacterium]
MHRKGEALRGRERSFVFLALLATGPFLPLGCGGGGGGGAEGSEGDDPVISVERPVFLYNLSGETGWFAPPVIFDLDHDGTNELIAAQYSLFVYDDSGSLIDRGEIGAGRVYAPHVVADLEGDGTIEIVVGRGHEVIVYEWVGRSLVLKNGWPADTTTGGNPPEIRGMAAGDLDGDGTIEVAVTTTQTVPTSEGGAQVFVFSHDGGLFQPAGGHTPAWPRYNALAGAGNDADRNGQGHSGYGCYGLNIAIGSIDDEADLEVVVTYDNHHIQAFEPDGVAIDASPWFTNRSSSFYGERLTWGQFIRWESHAIERDHYHQHQGDWPHPSWTEWLQWTASPPNIADIDRDGKNEVLGVPNVEMHEPYVTQAFAIMVLEGNHGDGSRSARRKPGWEELPRGGSPIQVSGWYPPQGIPAALTADLVEDERPEIVVSLNDGSMYAFSADGSMLWSHDYTHGKSIMYSSEPLAVDLNQDDVPEIVFTTYGDPNTSDSGHLVILDVEGGLQQDVPLPDPGFNGNGNGAPAVSVADLDGDGPLEIIVQTFDHGIDVFTVPGSSDNHLVWPTARGNLLRSGCAE